MKIDIGDILTKEEIDRRVDEYILNNKEEIDNLIGNKIKSLLRTRVNKAFESCETYNRETGKHSEKNQNIILIDEKANKVIKEVIEDIDIPKDTIKKKIETRINKVINGLKITL